MSKVEAAHQRLRETNSSSVAEQAEHQRRAEEFRHAEHAHLGDRGLEHGEQEAADGELAEIGDDADRRAPQAPRPAARCPRARTGRRSARHRAGA